jgi:hypothetical protein
MSRNGPFLLGILALLLAGAAYNYHRNAALDRDINSRPYERLSEADLEVLEKAYEGEVEALRGRMKRLGAPEGFFEEPTHRSDLAARVKAFERSQRTNGHWKVIHRKALEQEVELEAVRKEQEIRRAGLDRFWRRILRRVTTL